MLLGAQIQMVFVYRMSHAAHAQAVADINAALTAGKLKAHVGARYAFDAARAARAHDELDAGGLLGKGVVEVG